MKLKNPILFTLLGIFTLATLADIITSLFVQGAEANPIFLLTNNIYIISLIKLLFIVVLYYIYRVNIYKTHFIYYVLLLVVVLGSVLFILATYGNIIGMQHPELVEAAKDISNTVKVQQYSKFVGIIYVMPLLFSILTFKFYEWSLKYIKIIKQR